MSKAFIEYLFTLPHRIQKFGPKALIFERDDPVRCYFAVQKGNAVLLRRQENGAEVILQRAGIGEILAEASLNTRHYHCSANAVDALELAVFKRHHVQNLLETNQQAARAMVLHLGHEVQRARRRAEIISLKRVSDRLTAWLVWHDDVLPDKGEWHHLADEIGVRPEALYRELAKRR